MKDPSLDDEQKNKVEPVPRAGNHEITQDPSEGRDIVGGRIEVDSEHPRPTEVPPHVEDPSRIRRGSGLEVMRPLVRALRDVIEERRRIAGRLSK